MPKPSKSVKKRQKPTVQPRPFKSILLPYANDILAWRRAGKTWQEVVDELAKRRVKTDTSACCRFIERYRRRPYPRGAEPEPETMPSGPAQPAARPKPTTEDLAEKINAKIDRRAEERQAAKKLNIADFS